MNTKGGYNAVRMAKELQGNTKAQKYLKEGLLNIISGLK